ncbi:MAG: DUF3786 domain-containing protein [Thermoleophilia bacterium]
MESIGGAYARAIEEAVKEFQAAAPGVVETAAGVGFTSRAGAEAEGGVTPGVFSFPFMDREIHVEHPGGSVTLDGAPAVVAVTIVVLHYLTRSVGPLDLSEPARFQGLPGAGAYTSAFRSHAEVPLLQRFGEDGEAYVSALRALGARPADGSEEDSEVVWEVPFLPHLPLGVRLGLAEDTMPADCVIMFPRRAGFAYHVEDLAVAGEIFSARLLEVADIAADKENDHEHDLSTLVTVFDPVEADMVVSKLRSAGIEGIVQPEALSVVYGLTMEGHARHHVLVRTEDLVEARGALDLGEDRD